VAVLCALCTAAVLVLHARVAGFRKWEELSRDLVISNFTRRATVDPQLKYVALDDATLNVSGLLMAGDITDSPALKKMAAGWPWPRDVYAMLIDRLMQAGAKVVALDILFPTPREGDAELKAVLEKYKDRVVIGSNFADEEMVGANRTLALPTDELIADGKNDDRVGFVNFWPDEFGVVRTVRYTITDGEVYTKQESGQRFYSLGARVLQKASPGTWIPLKMRGLRFAEREGGGEGFQLPPVVKMLDVLAWEDAFARKRPEGFEPIPLYMLFMPKAWHENFKDGTVFKDKIVLVGPYGNSMKDQLVTPFGLMDGPEIHLNAINDALHEDFVFIPTEKEVGLIIVLMGFAAFGLASTVQRPLVLALTLAGITVAYVGAAAIMFDKMERVLPFLGPLLTFDLSSALSLYWKWLLERRERTRMRRMFERFVSKNVVKEMMDNRQSYLHQLGGVRKCVAILMTDIRGFTAMTEEADSTQLVVHLNEYLTEMVNCVFATNGTLDKFVGDAILAVWGNINSNGDVGDCTAAVTTALRMLESLKELNKGWMKRGWRELKMGVGINYGEVIFGAIGSEQKAEPTVIGDAVNSASRLEGLTKEYGVDLLIGESVAEHVKENFHLQLVDFVRVKGKTRALKVYSVLGEKVAKLDDRTNDYLRVYERAMGGYERGEFAMACSDFRAALDIKPDDPVATVFFERCAELAEKKPQSWDGVFVMHTK
jgi:adenylate cyclase